MALLLGHVGTAVAQTPEDLAEARDQVRQATAAREAGNLDAYTRHIQAALSLRPGHPELLYLLAGAHAMQGDTMPAIRLLCGLGSMGLSFPAGDDEAFAPLHDLPAFQNAVHVMAENERPTGTATTAFTLPGHETMLPEGLAHDPVSGDFFLAGAHSGRILRVGPDGNARVFADRAPDTWGFMGLALDPDRRRLWAVTTATEAFEGLAPADEGRSAVVVFDIDSGRRTGRHEPSDRPHALGDIAVAHGSVFVDDAAGGPLYTLHADAPADAPLRVLVPAGIFASPQGIAPAPDGRVLHVADHARGIFQVDVATGAVQRMAAPPLAALRGIDGLVRDGDHLIAIQNGTRPHRILRLDLVRGERLGEAQVLASALPEWDEPTQGTMVGDRFYFVANSQWPAFAGGSPDPGALTPPRIMWIEP